MYSLEFGGIQDRAQRERGASQTIILLRFRATWLKREVHKRANGEDEVENRKEMRTATTAARLRMIAALVIWITNSFVYRAKNFVNKLVALDWSEPPGEVSKICFT